MQLELTPFDVFERGPNQLPEWEMRNLVGELGQRAMRGERADLAKVWWMVLGYRHVMTHLVGTAAICADLHRALDEGRLSGYLGWNHRGAYSAPTERPPVAARQPKKEPEKKAEPKPQPAPEPEHFAEVTVTFRDGEPAAAALYRLIPDGAKEISGRLDRDGFMRATWRGATSCTFMLPELRTTTVELTEGVSANVDKPTELVAERPAFCHRLTGFLFDTDKSFLLPPAIEAMAKVRANYDRYPNRDVEVVGHTDTTGRQGYNQTLSVERAESMKAFLTDDADAWLSWYDDGKPEKKRSGVPGKTP